jgi:hypothetical protein
MKLFLYLVCGVGLAGCLDESLDDDGNDPELGTTTAELSGTVNPVDCGFSNGRQCKSAQSLASNVADTVLWDPCLGGSFTWTASVSFEVNYDRACVGGTATAGYTGGCTAGTELEGSGAFNGSGHGAIKLSVATDGSVTSSGITSLVATCDEPLYVGVFRQSAAGASQDFVDSLNWNVFTLVWDYRSQNGERLSQLEAWYDTDGTTRFDGVFVPGSGGYGLNAGMTLAQLKSQQLTNAQNGMELSDVDALQTPGGVVYIGVWRAGTRQQKIYDGTVSGFWPWSATYTDQGYQPTIVESYYDGNDVHRYTVVMTKTPGTSGWYAAVGIEYGAFTREWRKYKGMGWRLSQLETHVQGGIRYYDGFFLPGNNGEDFVPGAREGEWYPQLERNTDLGYELVDIDRNKLERTPGDPSREEKLARTEYPVVSPVWMAKAHDYFYENWGTVPLGYTVALMRKGRLLGASSFGYAKSPADGSVRMTADAQWDYLSDSKWITTLAAAKIAEDKGLDTTAIKIVPAVALQIGINVPNTADPKDFWHITVHQAMTHTSNLKDGGCASGAAADWDIYPNQNIQKAGGSGTYSYSGFDSCLLRLWVEKESGMSFERYVDTKLFRKNGIHNLDCKKDPEKSEVLFYTNPMDTNPGYVEPDAWCGHHGFKGTPMQLLQILQAVRTPGKMLSLASLNDMRTGSTDGSATPTPGMGGDEWTFFQDAHDSDGNGADAFGFSMTGGRSGACTHMAQFPADPQNLATAWAPASYQSDGVDAVFFTNAGPDAGFVVQWASIQADPNP